MPSYHSFPSSLRRRGHISFAWGIFFLFFSSVPQTFDANYGFGTFLTGLIQLAITVGALISTVINPLQDYLYLRTASKNTERPGKPIPEGRLHASIPSSIFFTGGFFMYGWSSQPHMNWIVPTIGACIVGVGIYSIYIGVVN